MILVGASGRAVRSRPVSCWQSTAAAAVGVVVSALAGVLPVRAWAAVAVIRMAIRVPTIRSVGLVLGRLTRLMWGGCPSAGGAAEDRSAAVGNGWGRRGEGQLTWRLRPAQYGARSDFLSILPAGLVGRESMKSTLLGAQTLPLCSLTRAMSSSGSTGVPRSEERRVGKGCGSRGAGERARKKATTE